MELMQKSDGTTEVVVHTGAAVFGKLGEFGQAVIRMKADQILAEFAKNISARLTNIDIGAAS